MVDVDALLPLPARAIVRVAVDVPLPHLDRPFDYEVPAAMDAEAVVGARVRVRFAGRLCDGFILERTTTSEVATLAPVEKVVSPEPVLTPAIAALIREVADRCAGTFADVMRLAVPPRHAATEKAARPCGDPPSVLPGPVVLGGQPEGASFLVAVAAGTHPRAAWHVPPVADLAGDWAAGFAEAAATAVAAGRGALLLAPDARDLARLEDACRTRFGTSGYVVITAESGPAARYRAFLAAARGQARVVIGTRAAVFAPVRDLGLVALYDDGDDLWAEPRAPYPHARDVACVRSSREHTALLLASFARSAEVAALVERGWLGQIGLAGTELRRLAPVVRAAAAHEAALAKDPLARAARLPHDAFATIRQGLLSGPVLVQVPRAGYRTVLACDRCRERAVCPTCAGPLRQDAADAPLSCGWCNRLVPTSTWTCRHCGGRGLRAGRVGSERTLDELGKAFPGVAVVSSSGAKVVAEVDDTPRLVVATPGGEPRALGGYAAAVLLDGALLLQRTDLRAAEESLRRWSIATALVRPAAQGGTVLVVAPPQARAVQALVRHGQPAFAAREVAERGEAHYPPSARWVEVDGDPAAVTQLRESVELPEDAEVLGPVPVPAVRPGESERSRLILRAPVGQGRALVAAVKAAQHIRSARKLPGSLRVRVDPVDIA